MIREFIHNHPSLLFIIRNLMWFLSFSRRPYLGLFTLYYYLKLKKCGLPVEFSSTMIIRNARNISIGRRCSFSNFVILDGHTDIIIGDNCMFANNTVVATATHNYKANPMNETMIKKKVVVGNNVWFGIGAIVLPGVHIGDGVVVGAGAVVTKTIPNNAIVVGVPAKIVGYRGQSENYSTSL
jgi:acetyltransferase-like isoleucine patch superfamily enzyme